MATFSALLLAVCRPISGQIYEQAQSHAVALGVRDPEEATFTAYRARFIVRDPAGQQYGIDKLVAAGTVGYVHFPNDFNVRPRPGRYRWACFASGRVAARGAFDYDNPGGFTLLSDAAAPSAIEGRDARRIVKAEAHARVIAHAVNLFRSHTGRIPVTLGELTRLVHNDEGAVAGPFFPILPSPPTGWSGYRYHPDSVSGAYTVTATGEGTRVEVP